MIDPDLPTGTGVVATLATAVGAGVMWAVGALGKKYGFIQTSVAEVNNQAQKDMLDWQRQQLTDEVTRRERAELLNQTLNEKLNGMQKTMDRLELLNTNLQEQVQVLTDKFTKLQQSIAEAKIV